MLVGWASRLALCVPLGACIWGLVACLIAPTQWTILVPSVACGISVGVLIGSLWSLSFQP